MKNFSLAAFALVASLSPVTGLANPTTTTRTMHVLPAARSGAFLDSFSRIRAQVRLQDDGSTLTIAGVGSGFDPNLQFVSLIYATPSATRGALACLPPTPNPYSPPQMFVAYWLPVGSTTRTLFAQKTVLAGTYVTLKSIATMSVRFDSTPQVGNPAATTQTPGRYFLQSCGNV